jgi:hypothetical protein
MGRWIVLAVVALLTLFPAGVRASQDEEKRQSTEADQGSQPARRPTPVVITNETLSRYSDQGNVTTASPGRSTTPSAGDTQPDSARPFSWDDEGGASPPPETTFDLQAEYPESEQREYWRGLYEQQLDLVRSLEEQIAVLDEEIPGLWREFYARDDPMYRDGVIKPKLDEALERRGGLEEKLQTERERLPEILEKARRAGSKPGWFRGLDRPVGADDSQKKTDRQDSITTDDFDVHVVDADDT